MGKLPLSTKDPRGKTITVSSSNYYGHIQPHGHTEITPSIIESTLNSPDYIYQNPEHANREDYYKAKTLQTGKHAYTKVVTECVDEYTNTTITAYTTKKIKGGLKMKYIINNITYDSKYDILYVNFRTSSNSYGEEDIDHLVIFKDFDTEEITGLTIFDFKRLFEKKDKVLDTVSKFLNTKKVYSELCR